MAVEANQNWDRINELIRTKTAVKPGLALLAAGLAIVWATAAVSQGPIPQSSHPMAGPAAAFGQSAAAEAIAQVGSAGEMIGFSHTDGSGTQTITLVHTGKSWMAVYHIDRSGQIRLVSSRPVDADFSLQLNATSPLPEEIRRLSR